MPAHEPLWVRVTAITLAPVRVPPDSAGVKLRVVITCAGSNPARDLQLLRAWLPKADPELPVCFDPPPSSDDHLSGELLTEVLTGISASADLVTLCAAVAGWVHNYVGRDVDTRPHVKERRSTGSETVTAVEVGTVTITIISSPGELEPVVSRDDS